MDINKIRADFPILSTKVYGKDLVYFDNGATTQKPQVVIDSLVNYYTHYNSNVHRGVHYLSQQATELMEQSRESVAKYINAAKTKEIIFTRGTTESVNLVASAFGNIHLNEDDEILTTVMEHHSNMVPWQMIAQEKKATVKYIPFDENGELILSELDNLITTKTKIIALTWVSNTLGTVNPIEKVIAKAKEKNIPILIDAAQAIQHTKIDVQVLDVDFLVFSGHKMYAPTGVGVLYMKEKWGDLVPYQGGGSMIKEVKLTGTTYADIPFRYEAGTPNIADNIALGTAIDYIDKIGIENIEQHESELMKYAVAEISKNKRNLILGNPNHRMGAISLIFDGAHPSDVGELLDKQGVAVRTGHHCCQPIMDFYQIPGTLRISFGLYNTQAEIDIAVNALDKALSML